ncbi:MAG TPA: type 1 glutamine amidotransferase domain-containing protein [Acidimicrobiales bacterium]
MSQELEGRTIAFIVSNEGIEQAELTRPWKAVSDAGGHPVLVAPKAGTVQAFIHLDKADTFPVDRTTADARVDDFDAAVLPGGVANADELRTDERAVALVRDFFDTGRPVGVICHGPWTIVEADKVRGRTLTSWPSLQTDIRNAGGEWVDREVQVCESGPNVLISSRKPDDLDAFNAKLLEIFSAAKKFSQAT